MKKIQLSGRLQRPVSIRLTFTLFASALFLIPVGGAFAQTAPPGPLPATAPVYEPVKNRPSERVSQPSTRTGRPAIAALLGGKPDLSGSWNINTDQSDDPRKKLAQAAGSSNGAGGGNHGGWSTGGGWGGMGGGQPSGGMGGGQRSHGSGTGNGQDAESRDLLGDMSQLTIEQTATTLKVKDPSGDLLVLYTDAPNSSHTDSATGSSSSSSSGASSSPSSTTASSGSSGNTSSAPVGGSSTTSGNASTTASGTPVAHWEGNQLVVETKGQHGSSLTRTFVLSSDNQQLYVTTELKSPRFKQPVVIDSVYDPAQ